MGPPCDDPLQREERERITIVLPMELARRLVELATQRHVSLSALVRIALAHYLVRSEQHE